MEEYDGLNLSRSELARLQTHLAKQNPSTIYAKCVNDTPPEMYLDEWIEEGQVYIVKMITTNPWDDLVVMVADRTGHVIRPSAELDNIMATRFNYYAAYNN